MRICRLGRARSSLENLLTTYVTKMACTADFSIQVVSDEPEDTAFHNKTGSAVRRVIDQEAAVSANCKDAALESADLNKKVLSSWLRVHFLIC